MSISIDEDIYDFYNLKDYLKADFAEQIPSNPALKSVCLLLYNARYSLTIRFYGNQSFLETSVQFTEEDIYFLTKQL